GKEVGCRRCCTGEGTGVPRGNGRQPPHTIDTRPSRPDGAGDAATEGTPAEASGGRGRPRAGHDEPTAARPGRLATTPARPPPHGTTARDGAHGPAPRAPAGAAAPRPGAAPARPGPGSGTPGETGHPHTGTPADGEDRPAPDRPAPVDRPAADAPPAPPEHPDTPPATGRDPRTPGPGAPHQPPPPPPPAAAPGGPEDDRTLAHSGPGKGPQRPPEQSRGGLLMGRPFGVPVYVAPSWFLVAILITWVFGGQIDRVLPELGAASYLGSLFFAVARYASVLRHELALRVPWRVVRQADVSRPELGAARCLVSLCFAVAFCASLLVHELAPALAALRFKLPVRRIQLQFFGGVSEIEKEAETPGREFVLAFVGPLLSLVLSGVFYLGLLAVDPSSVPGVLLAGLMISNLIVAVFNLLPGLPLDGGRMLRAVVWKLTGRPMTGTVAAAWVGRALAVSVLVGLPLLTQSGA